MAVARRDIEALLDIVLLYVPRPQARQLLGDVLRSRAAEHSVSLKETAQRLMAALDARQKEATR